MFQLGEEGVELTTWYQPKAVGMLCVTDSSGRDGYLLEITTTEGQLYSLYYDSHDTALGRFQDVRSAISNYKPPSPLDR